MLSKRTKAFFSFLLLVAALLATSPALAQSTATLQGTVSDSKGAVLPNATVLVRNRSTSSERTTQTDSEGNYQFAALPVGLYTVEVRVEGFKTQVADQVTIEVAKTVVQNFQMDVGAITEQVLVSSDVPVIETCNDLSRHSHQPANGTGDSTQRPSLRRSRFAHSRLRDAATERLPHCAATWPGLICIQHCWGS